jgi:hypothetical protein
VVSVFLVSAQPIRVAIQSSNVNFLILELDFVCYKNNKKIFFRQSEKTFIFGKQKISGR